MDKTKGFLYQVTESNVDGCGSQAVEYIRFQTDKPLTKEQMTSFQNTLCLVKRQNHDDLTTSDMIEDALVIFGRINDIQGELCASPFAGGFEF